MEDHYMLRKKLFVRSAIAAVVIALLAVPTAVMAHETRPVGDYEFVVGWSVEPSYEGQMNGVSLRVRTPGTPPTPVEGVEENLQVEVTYIATGQTVTEPLETVFNNPGLYIAHMLPTAAGQYEFRFFGTINGDEINETFTSGDRFDNINSTEDIQFPEKVAQVREVQGIASEAAAVADDADSAASSAQTLAYVGIGLAVIAIVGAGASFAIKRK
jgi:hypothetical protein